MSVIPNFNLAKVFLIVVSLTAGTVLLMWMGELITQRGIGNGISLLIFASIVARIPNGVHSWWTNPDQVFKVIMPFIVIGVVAAIVFVQEGQRRIPIQYAKRVIGRRMTQGTQTYLPLRVNMAGVIPVIFAASMMAIPPTLGQFLGQNRNNFWTDVQNFFSPQGWHYVVGESLLIIVFTYFYTAVTFNPVDQAENLRKYGGFIPGVRPGRPTAEFLDRILARLTFPGALFLAAVAALPTILISQTSANFFFGGTSILIVIGVALDTMKQLEAQLMMRNYEGFLSSPGGLPGRDERWPGRMPGRGDCRRSEAVSRNLRSGAQRRPEAGCGYSLAPTPALAPVPGASGCRACGTRCAGGTRPSWVSRTGPGRSRGCSARWRPAQRSGARSESATRGR